MQRKVGDADGAKHIITQQRCDKNHAPQVSGLVGGVLSFGKHDGRIEDACSNVTKITAGRTTCIYTGSDVAAGLSESAVAQSHAVMVKGMHRLMSDDERRTDLLRSSRVVACHARARTSVISLPCCTLANAASLFRSLWMRLSRLRKHLSTLASRVEDERGSGEQAPEYCERRSVQHSAGRWKRYLHVLFFGQGLRDCGMGLLGEGCVLTA
jgi:hypothetical protein